MNVKVENKHKPKMNPQANFFNEIRSVIVFFQHVGKIKFFWQGKLYMTHDMGLNQTQNKDVYANIFKT